MKKILSIIILLLIGLAVQLYGVPYNQEFQVNTCSDGSQENPDVCSFSDGGFVVCWASYGQDSSGYGVYGQLFNTDGEKQGAEFQVNTYTEGHQKFPSVCSLSDGGFVVCWMSDGQNGSESEIYGQLFSRDGEKQGGEFQVNPIMLNYIQVPAV